jgi:hypothetical protein
MKGTVNNAANSTHAELKRIALRTEVTATANAGSAMATIVAMLIRPLVVVVMRVS